MSEPSSTDQQNDKNNETTGDIDPKDAIIAALQTEVELLKSRLCDFDDDSTTLFASNRHNMTKSTKNGIPERGMSGDHARELIIQAEQLDFKPRLNTSSYVNVVTEKQEREVALLGLQTNLADASVYPASVGLHDTVVNWLAKLWNAPEPKDGPNGDYCGAGTVGSTEACLLAGLAHKFRWRKWYAARNNMTKAEVEGIRPNIVISTCYQAAWEKLFRYFDVDPKFVKPNMLLTKSAVDPKAMADACDERTIAVVAILGNHYNGVYDPVWDIDRELRKMNEEKGFQVGIHVDGASGAFIAPFQVGPDGKSPPPFDFRLESVLSISASGHKFGESICGTGWIVFRQREDLAEHIAVSVTYLGGHCDSMTLNFSRPASATYVQIYKLLRLGKNGYRNKVRNQMNVAAYMRSFMKGLMHESGKPRFQILDGGEDDFCLPVVAARLNPELDLKYDDIDLQHALSESHWYVSGYSLGFENFAADAREESLFTDVPADATMFRIVCKSNLTMGLAEDLMQHLAEVLPVLDSMQDGYSSVRASSAAARAQMQTMSLESNALATLAATKMLRMSLKGEIRQGYGKHPKRAGSVHAVC